MEIIYDILDIKSIITHWVKDYKVKNKKKIYNYDFYFDPIKEKVIFKLYIDKE